MPRLVSGELLGKLKASILASAFLLSSLPAGAAPAFSQASGEPAINALPPAQDGATDGTAAQEQAPGKPLLYTPPGAETATPQAAATDPAPPAVAQAVPASSEPAPQPAPQEEADSIPGTPAAAGSLAQAPGLAARSTDPVYRKVPTNVGSVQIRKPFKVFVSQQLIHNLSFRDTPVKEVIAEIARRGNLNVIIDKSVVGRITGELHDVTLNEAMDNVITSAGLQHRELDNSTSIIGTPNALFQLGLNRPMARAFKLSYATAFDIASLLTVSVFNRGTLPDFSAQVRSRNVTSGKEAPTSKTAETTIREQTAAAAGGGTQQTKTTNATENTQSTLEDTESGEEMSSTTRPDQSRTLKGSSRTQIQEGMGFNAAATDPGSQQIRAYQETAAEFTVDQNGGGAIVIPDARNRQVIVCGTPEDISIAEECIRLLDRRPKQIHIQASLIELNNAGIRQLGANLSLQGQGASGTLLGGGNNAPLVNMLPGLGGQSFSALQSLTDAAGNVASQTVRQVGIPPLPLLFTRTVTGVGTLTQNLRNMDGTNTPTYFPAVTPAANPAGTFNGYLGTAMPLNPVSIAGVQALNTAQSGLNFLTLSRDAGGRANIATMPAGLNLSLNLVLQTNKAKILANPSVTVNDNTESLITLANEVVHKVTSTVSLGVVSVNVELVKAGIFLDVLPRVTEDGFIVMRLRPQVSSPLGPPQTFAQGNVVVTLLNVREVISQEVRVKDGQTLVIGGLFTEQESATLAKVPYLAEAPILGALFRNSVKGRNRTELMLLITPKIVEEQPNTSVSDSTPAPTM